MVAVESVRRVDVGPSWRAIFAGVVLGFVTQFVLTLLGVAVGLSSLDVGAAGSNVRSVGLGTGLWTLLSAVVSWFVGAAFASYLSGGLVRVWGVLHGLTTWGVGLLVVLSLLGSGMAGALSSGFGLVGKSAELFGRSGPARQQLQQGARELGREAQEKLGQLGPEEARQAADAAAMGAWGALFTVVLSLGAAAAGGAFGASRLERRFEKPGRPLIEKPVTAVMTPRTT
ncbi:MAG: hypothetical protein RL199_2121 [Pseudomonadota bacterium]|jgi:hypothetical protein